MLFLPLGRARSRALYAAAAVLLPVPLALAGPLNSGRGLSASPDARTHAASMTTSVVEPPPPAPYTAEPTPSDAQSEQAAEDASRQRRSTGPAVVTKSIHERVGEISANTTYDVPLAALNAYRNAAASLARTDPGCSLSWGVIAAIGQVESGHGRFGGAAVLANGTTSPIIVGLPLNGDGVAAIRDTDDGRLDGDKVWDRAVGPMQFIPSTWAVVGTDGDGNGKINPHDFDDASLSTARYLCSGGADMSMLTQARGAVLRYNHSEEYVDLVLRLANAYDSGVVDVVPNDVAPGGPGRTQPSRSPDPTRSQQTRQVRVSRPTAPEPATESPTPTTPKPTTPKPPAPKQPAPKPPAPKPPAPKPTPPDDPTPQPPPPKPTPPDDPAPQPPPPTVETVEGVLTACDFSWCVAGRVLGLSPNLDQRDYDGDGATETIRAELEGLEGATLQVTLTDDLVTEIVVQSMPEPAAEPQPEDPATTGPTPTPATPTSTTTEPTATSASAP